jgi:hypothetical protein
MIEIFGDFIDNLPSSQEYLIIGFSPSSASLKQRWRNNGLSADFLADYLSTFFPRSDEENAALEKQEEIRGAVSYIANELLENAMKYNYECSSLPISIQLHLHGDKIVFEMTNNVDPVTLEYFQSYLKSIVDSDPEEMYINQLEKNAMNLDSQGSGLGFLTIMNDYGARLGWKFKYSESVPKDISLTTMVQLDI